MNGEATSPPGKDTVPATNAPWKVEFALALAGTAFVLVILFLAAIYAGPLWRDETNTLNVALMPWKDLWKNLPFESFPPLWLVLVRAWGIVGMADSDAGIRLLSFFVGASFLGSLWLCVRWIGGRTPTLSLALLGSLPAFVFAMSSNRAYGLAMCLLLLTFGAVWRLVESTTRTRMLLAGLTSLFFVQCLYYDIIFLGAMLLGGSVVALRRKAWKTLGALAGIGAASGATLLIYLPVIQKGSSYVRIVQGDFGLRVLWLKVKDALALRSSAEPPATGGSWIWPWLWLIVIAVVVAVNMQSQRPQSLSRERRHTADLALFSILALVSGCVGYGVFLLRLQFPTQSWYYMVAATLAAISLEGVLSVRWSAPRPWGIARVAFLVIMISCGGRWVWREAHTRRSNIDLVAAILNENAKVGDLIVVHSAFEGITFDRYYHGGARWVTIPPINSHKVHRSDLILAMMNQRNAMAPTIADARDTLGSGKSVWVVGRVRVVGPEQLSSAPPPVSQAASWNLLPYWEYWPGQLTADMLGHGAQVHTLTAQLDVPVNFFEDVPLLRFSGFNSSKGRRDGVHLTHGQPQHEEMNATTTR